MKTKDFRIEKSPNEDDRKSNQIEDGPIDLTRRDDIPKDETETCRICFSNESTEANPLFAPCKCTGTMQFIHYICLKSWLNLKLVSQSTPQLLSYYWKSFECEICKTIYPCILYAKIVCIEHLGKKYYLADVDIPETGNFILFESLLHEKNTSRIIHVIKPNDSKNTFKLGRGHESDVRISDISVSRFHAILRCTEDGFYIGDNNSKFGTLALIESLEITPDINRTVQVGRTIANLSLKKKKSFVLK